MELFHLPSNLMLESEIPFVAAVVAALEQKLCPEKPGGSLPVVLIASFSSHTKANLVSGFPEENRNKNPGELLRTTNQDNKAATGHSLQ